jgi:5'-deoxy-5'-methylthioadenosine phosphorylase
MGDVALLAFITGSGFYDLPAVVERSQRDVDTPYGRVPVTVGRWDGTPVALLPRHGGDHSVAPQQINYRANIWALRHLGAAAIVATAVSGGIDPALQPGDLVLIDDFLDWTTGRATTFFDEPGAVRHTDMSQPYDPGLRALLAGAASLEGVALRDGGTYVCFNGPRFESRAEIRAAAALGAHLVGMTGYPEVALAVEAGVPYASLGVISNPAAGLAERDITLDEIMAVLDGAKGPLLALFGRAVRLWSERAVGGGSPA